MSFGRAGPLSVTLQANTYYFIGQIVGITSAYSDDQGLGPSSLSFATALKGVFQYGTFATPSSFAPIQSGTVNANVRLTTALP